MALEVARSYTEWMEAAAAAASNDDFDKAIMYYQKAIKLEPHEARAYNRAMILLRKTSRLQEELSLIEKAIDTFTRLQKKKAEKLLSKKAGLRKLSQSLAIAMGTANKKGEALTHTEPISSWLKRKAAVEQKLAKPVAKKKPVKKAPVKPTLKKPVKTAVKKTTRKKKK